MSVKDDTAVASITRVLKEEPEDEAENETIIEEE